MIQGKVVFKQRLFSEIQPPRSLFRPSCTVLRVTGLTTVYCITVQPVISGGQNIRGFRGAQTTNIYPQMKQPLPAVQAVTTKILSTK